jgi:hypothetical protein
MNQDYSDHFDEFNEATIADAAKRFESMLQRKKLPTLAKKYLSHFQNITW